MKQTLLLILLFLSSLAPAKGKSLEAPTVNKNVELLCIVFRLAGNQEYNLNAFKYYTDRVDHHFSPYQNHELIRFARELKRNKGISYDAVVSMGVALDKGLNPMMDLSTTLPEKRWTKDDALTFIHLLKAFYRDADCKGFFRENEPLFQEMANCFNSIYKSLDLNWFQQFFGAKADESFHLLLSPGCGVHNYGPSYTSLTGKKEVFALLGQWKFDASGIPVYLPENYLPLMVHEFNHSFVNPIMTKQSNAFETSGKTLYKLQEFEMSKQQAYGDWSIMLNEALVRASVIKYFIDHGASETETANRISQEVNNGFLWIKPLVAELKTYDSQRNRYPTLESYLPVLATVYQTYATSITEYDAQRPRVDSIAEFANYATNVIPQLNTITIHFDRPLSGKGYSINYGALGKAAYPQIDSIYYTNANQSVVLNVRLKPETTYQFVLFGKNFKTDKGVALKAFEVAFRTGN